MLTATSIEGRLLFPLSEFLDASAVPDDIAKLDRDTNSFLNSVYFADSSLQPVENGFMGTLVLVVLEEIVISPFGEAAGLVIGGGGGVTVFEARVRLQRLPGGFRFKIGLYDVAVGLRISPTILRPLKPGTNDPEPPHVPLDIQLGAVSITFGTEEPLSVTWTGSPSIPRCMIGESGVIISAGAIRWLTPQSEDLPSDTPPAFLGMYLDDATIELNSLELDSNPSLTLDYAFIGRGGFSGRIDLQNLNLSGSLAGFTFTLRDFGLTLVQNSITASNLLGRIELPFFDQPLDVAIGIMLEGGLSLAVDSPGGLVRLRREGVFEFEIESIGFLIDNGLFMLALSGEISPLVGGLGWPSFRVQELSIDSRGRVELAGGWINLPSVQSINLHGFRIEVSRIGFGTDDDGTRWIGLSGGVQLVSELPMGGSVEGLKIKWRGGERWLELRGIGVDLTMENTLKLKGSVEFLDDESRKGFKGGMELVLIPTNIRINAQLLVARNTASPAFNYAYVFLDGELPSGIPLLNTGLALYGLAGLVGYNVEPRKEESDSWYEGWYKRRKYPGESEDVPEGVSAVAKWRDKRGAFALGAGATIGTASDNGYAFHGRFLLVFLLPGPVVLLDGKSSLLRKRGDGGTPNFTSLAVLDGRAGTLLFNLGAQYQYPDSGKKLLKINGHAEAFFDFGNPRRWHLYLGQEAPMEKRIRASILSLFEANTYFMLRSSGVRMGAWFGYKGRWKKGPLKVTLDAWVEGGAAVSWAPKQFEGSLRLRGEVALRAFGRGIGLGLGASIVASTPTPYRVHAQFKVKLRLPWPLPDPKAKITLLWKENVSPPTPRPLEVLALEHLKVIEKWIMAGTDDRTKMPVVPLDARPVLNFQRSMWDDTGLAVQANPPSPERAGKYLYRYRLKELKLMRRPAGGGTWTEAVPTGSGNFWTTWQAVPTSVGDDNPQALPPNTKLLLWSRTPFDYGRETEGTAYTDGFLDGNPDWPAKYDWNPITNCVDFQDFPITEPPDWMPNWNVLDELVVATREARVQWLNEQKQTRKAVFINGRERYQNQNEPLDVRENQAVIRIVFPPNTARAILHLGLDTDGVLSFPAGSEPELGMRGPEAPRPLSRPRGVPPASDEFTFQIEVGRLDERRNLTCIDLLGNVRLAGVCIVSRDEWDRQQAGERAQSNLCQNANTALEAAPPLLEPHHEYKLEVRTEVERSGNGGQSWSKVGDFADDGYFRTQSAPGIDAVPGGGSMAPSGGSEKYPEAGPLRDLTPYVAATVPRHGQNFVYRSYDVGIEFNESYTEQMYLLEGKPLALTLRDANGQSPVDADGKPLLLLNQRRIVEEPETTIPPRLQLWRRQFEHPGCEATKNLQFPDELWATHPRLLLKPRTIYRATLGPVLPRSFAALAADGTLQVAGGAVHTTSLAARPADVRASLEERSDGRKLVIGSGVAVELVQNAVEEGRGAFQLNAPQEIRRLDPLRDKAEPRPDEQQRVYDWTFTTSRFASFTDHIHSCSPELVSYHQERGRRPGALLNARQIDWLKSLLPEAAVSEIGGDADPKKREAEALKCDRVLAALGMEERPLPEILKMTLLDDGGRSYGLLLESPEPLDWERITMQLEHWAEAEAPTSFRPQEFRICRSLDESRALFYFPNAGEPLGDVPSGTLRFSWTYRRRRSPTSSNDEVVHLDVVVQHHPLAAVS